MQGEHVLNVAAEETLDGADAWVLHLRCQGKPSAQEMARWEARLRLQAMDRSKYFYEFTPVQRTVDGKPRAGIELKLAGEEGPGTERTAGRPAETPRGNPLGRSADRSGNPGVSRAGTAGDRAQQRSSGW